MHKRGSLQIAAIAVVGIVSGAFLLGQALDSVQNALALVSPLVTYAGTAALMGGGALLHLLLRAFPQRWVRAGSHLHVTALGPLAWAPILGAVGLLWVPRLLPQVQGPSEDPRMAVPSPSSFFPHYVGATWTYTFGRLTQEGSGSHSRIEKELGRYTDTVMVIRAGAAPSVKTIGLQRTGLVPRLLECSPNQDGSELVIRGDAGLWLVTDERRVFEACTREAAAELSQKVSTPLGTARLPPPEYVLPFVVGALWGADPDDPPRSDEAYQWLVDSEAKVETPAGRFTDCYLLAYSTLPDHQLRWVCRGVGLVAWEYHHHGTIEEYRAELTSWSVPTAR